MGISNETEAVGRSRRVQLNQEEKDRNIAELRAWATRSPLRSNWGGRFSLMSFVTGAGAATAILQGEDLSRLNSEAIVNPLVAFGWGTILTLAAISAVSTRMEKDPMSWIQKKVESVKIPSLKNLFPRRS